MRKQNIYEVWSSEYLMKHKHKNVIDIVDVYEDSSFIFIVMGYVRHGEIDKNEDIFRNKEQKNEFINQILEACSFHGDSFHGCSSSCIEFKD